MTLNNYTPTVLKQKCGERNRIYWFGLITVLFKNTYFDCVFICSLSCDVILLDLGALHEISLHSADSIGFIGFSCCDLSTFCLVCLSLSILHSYNLFSILSYAISYTQL